MSLYPPSAECEVCCGGCRVGGQWICDKCRDIAVELGIEVDQFHCPSEEVRKKIWDVMMERQRAETKRRSDEQARGQRPTQCGD